MMVAVLYDDVLLLAVSLLAVLYDVDCIVCCWLYYMTVAVLHDAGCIVCCWLYCIIAGCIVSLLAVLYVAGCII